MPLAITIADTTLPPTMFTSFGTLVLSGNYSDRRRHARLHHGSDRKFPQANRPCKCGWADRPAIRTSWIRGTSPDNQKGEEEYGVQHRARLGRVSLSRITGDANIQFRGGIQ